MRLTRIIINATIPFFLIIFFASILTTKPYLMISKGLYPSHERVYFDHDYAIDHIIGYLNYRYDNLEFGENAEDDSVILRPIEIRHMVDVKNLYTALRVAALAAFIVGGGLLYYQLKKDKRELYKTIKYMPVFPILFIVFLGTFMLLDFSAAFTAFHHLFFTNDEWQLQYNDVLIILLPINFWMVSGIIILGLFGISIGTLYVLNEKIIKKSAF